MIKITKHTKATAAQHGVDLNVLGREKGIADGSNLGGEFRLPEEFNRKLYASAFIDKRKVGQSRAREVLINTDRTAEGWEVWKYPDTTIQFDINSGKDEEMPHDQAGKPHVVTTGTGVEYVLMFRPIGVQQAVNYVYAEVSRQRMNAEVNGETAAGSTPEDSGILTEERLSRISGLQGEMLEAEMERDASSGAVVAAHGADATHITRKSVALRKEKLKKKKG